MYFYQPEMNVEHTDRDANGKRDENHREEKVFALKQNTNIYNLSIFPKKLDRFIIIHCGFY